MLKSEKQKNAIFNKIKTGYLSMLGRFYEILDTKKKLLVFLFTWSFILNYFLEAALRKNLLLGFVHLFAQPLTYLYNTLIIFCFFSFIFLFKRRLFYFTVMSVFWLVLAITNYIVLLSRNTPLNAPDFRIIKSAFGVVKIYLNMFEQILVIALIVLAITLLVLSFVKGRKSNCSYKYSAKAVSVIAGITLVTTFIHSSFVFAAHFSDLPNAYKKYGFAYSFMCSVFDRGIDKPKDYSDEAILALKEQLEDDEAGVSVDFTGTAVSKETPNIIFLQLESFYDPMNIEGLSFNEDPIPVFRSLMNSYTSGKLTVPSIGAGTANTEFEVITGMDIDYFGVAEYPYLSILQNNVCESVAYNIKEYGYTAHAMHNHTGSFYDRHIVFPNLGFDTFTSIENMRNIHRNETGWAKDSMLTYEINTVLDSTKNEADLIYAISVQGHGKYPANEDVFNSLYNEKNPAHIKITGNENDAEKPGVDYWVNQVHDMDAFIGSLITSLEMREEPTVLCMYGDHLPSFTLDNWKLKEGNLYQTQVVLWNNFGMEKDEDIDLHSFELSSYVMRMFGFDSGYVNELHQKNAGKALSDYAEELHLLQYDMLYGEKKLFNGESPYLPTNIRYGTRPLEVEAVKTVGNNAYIYGGVFNEYTRVYINGSRKNTLFISEGCVSVTTSLKKGDKIKVVQVTTDLVEVGESNSYEYDV